MGAAQLNYHASYRPASEILAERDKRQPTPPGDPLALAELAKAKALVCRPRGKTAPITAKAWGATPRPVRRNVLNLAGLDPERWESPIHSFTSTERHAMRAAALRGVRAYEQVLNAI